MRTVLLALATLAFANTSSAQSNCGPRDTVVAKLAERYGESRVGAGLQNAQNIIEIWVSHETGTWTVLRTNVRGSTCIMASGTNWRPYQPQPQGEEM